MLKRPLALPFLFGRVDFRARLHNMRMLCMCRLRSLVILCIMTVWHEKSAYPSSCPRRS